MDLLLILGIAVAALVSIGLVVDVLRRHAHPDDAHIAHGDGRDPQSATDAARGPRPDGTLGATGGGAPGPGF